MNLHVGTLAVGLIGLILAIAGYPLYRISVRVSGALLGVYLGGVVGSALAHWCKLDDYQIWFVLACGIILALLASSILRKWIKTMLFLAGFTLGIMLSGIPVEGLSPGGIASAFRNIVSHVSHGNLWALAAGLLGGILGIFLERSVVIVLTSFVGSYLLFSVYPHPWILGLVMIAGVLCQTVVFKRA